MARCRHHSGYLADDEAAHSTYVAPLPKKHLLPEMRPTCKLGRVPHLPSMNQYSEHQSHQQNFRHPLAFGGFLDFLTEGQVLDSLQTVVEQATERLAAMKTEAGVPLVDIQDPVEVPSSRHRSRARPSIDTVHRHRARPTLCAGRPNNYPSCSSSMSDSHSSITAGWLGSHSQDSDLGARGIGSLPPMRDKLLLEKNLKRLLRLENKGPFFLFAENPESILLPEGFPAVGLTGQPNQQSVDPGAAPVLVLWAIGLQSSHP